MANGRFWAVLIGLWAAGLILFPLFPILSVLDPLFLLLVFLGLHCSSGRFLWADGMVIGFLKDVSTGGFFGAWTCTFGLIGWLMGNSRHLLEREDPIVQGVWAGFLTGLSNLVYILVCSLCDSSVRFGAGWGGMILLTMGVAGICAKQFFPRFERWCRIG